MFESKNKNWKWLHSGALFFLPVLLLIMVVGFKYDITTNPLKTWWALIAMFLIFRFKVAFNNQKERTMRKKLLFGILSIFLLPLSAVAGHQICGNQEVPASVSRCPDGSIPMYIAEVIKPNVQPMSDFPNLEYYFGVWRTNIPGAVWASPSGYSGYDWLHVSSGVLVGDLIIRPDGTYVWNSYGGKAGRWASGDAEYPIILIDTVENRRWKVGADPKHTGGRDIIVWDGNAFYYDGRK